MKTKIRKMLAGLAAILMFMACSFSAYAASGSYSITAAIPVESEPYTAASCDLYLVGRAGSHGDIIWNEIYAKYGVDGSKEGIKNAANNLMPFIRRDGIEPDRTATADGAGIIRFTDLPEGVYLISGDSFDIGSKTYHPIPTLAVLPYWNGTGWVQDVQVEIKSEIEDHGGGGGNTPNDSEKPNGSEDPSDPTEPEGPENPEDPDDPGPVDPGEPEEPVNPDPESPEPGDDPEQNDPSNPATPGDNGKPAAPDGDADRDRLPQTGQNWTVVIVLLFVGGGLLLIGTMSRQADDSEVPLSSQLKREMSRVLIDAGIVSLCIAGSITGWNFYESNAGKEYSENVGVVLQEEITKMEGFQAHVMPQSDGWENSMVTYEIDGTAFVGMLSIPSLGLDLPVAADWSEDQLKKTVCRYYGSSDDENLVICGHSYKGHFGRLQTLHAGDEVSFTDVDGSQHIYSVRKIETLESDEIKKMIQSDFDLTLFTCTFGGGERIAIRCEKT